MSVKQFYALFMLASFSPLIRLTSAAGARLAGRAGWVSVFISCAVLYGLIALFSLYFRRADKADLYSLYKTAFGKAAANVLAMLYAVWVFILAGYYLGMFSERFAGGIMPGVSAEFFTITLLALVFIILSGEFRSFALLGNISFYMVLTSIAVIFLLQLPKIRPENLLPVTTYDAEGILMGSLPMLGVFAYLTPLLFISGTLPSFKKHGLYCALTLLAVNIVIVMSTIGVFGADLTKEMRQPFLMSVKTMGAQGALERLESVFLLLWVVTDLAIIVMFLHVLLKLTGTLTGVQKPAIFRAPLILGVYVLSGFLIRDMSGTAAFTERIGLPVNLIMGFGLPGLAVMVGVVRLKAKKKSG
ncbi:MAG: spore germination protein [Oscillospiraceae bacterium]|nr:spore germination protein [Oscillospiraceae bacterium]